jgi:hypothetical protein
MDPHGLMRERKAVQLGRELINGFWSRWCADVRFQVESGLPSSGSACRRSARNGLSADHQVGEVKGGIVVGAHVQIEEVGYRSVFEPMRLRIAPPEIAERLNLWMGLLLCHSYTASRAAIESLP